MAKNKDKNKKKKENISVVAELTVTSPGVKEVIQSFDKAWHRAFELPTPVSIKFNDFVRKDAAVT